MRKAVIVALVSVAFFSTNQAQNTVPLLDSIVSYRFNSEQDSVPSLKWEYHYNLDGQQIYYSLYSWSGGSQKWYLIESDNRVFNQHGYQVEQIQYAAYERGLGYPYVKHEWEYDTHGNPLSMNQFYKY